ncbi:hypothetical protein [Otoolea muris]|uniref:hypothetical protein n=1 Tax=Otoolea muris TaxID=2941515 RepID=UPI00203D8BB4|nr:hypothetical protein [Otoolea muris]
MAFTIKNPPEFTLEIPQWDRDSLGDGIEMAKVPEALLNNEVYLKAVAERLEHVTPVMLPTSGWTGTTAPFTQTVAVSGAVDGMEPMVVSGLADGASAAAQKAYIKAYGIVCSGTAELGNGTATFKVYKKPASDITVGLKGV